MGAASIGRKEQVGGIKPKDCCGREQSRDGKHHRELTAFRGRQSARG